MAGFTTRETGVIPVTLSFVKLAAVLGVEPSTHLAPLPAALLTISPALLAITSALRISACTSAGVFDTICLEHRFMEGLELVEIGEESVLSASNKITDGTVKEDDAVVGTRLFGSEEGLDVLAVHIQLLPAMGEEE